MDTTWRDDALTEQRTEELLNAPAGQTMLALIEGLELSPSQAADPLVSAYLVVQAMDLISPWDPLTPLRLDVLRDHLANLHDTARGVASHPATRAWWAPLDASAAQLWSAHAGAWSYPTLGDERRPDWLRWERYAHQPRSAIRTSTAIAGDVSQLVIATACGTNDLFDPNMESIARRLIRIGPDPNIFEIRGPSDWADLCTQYPDQIPPETSAWELNGVFGDWEAGECVPDWQAVARDWDGVHLTTAGLLTSSHTWVSHALGRSRLWGWECELTMWMHDRFAETVELPAASFETLRVDGPPLLERAPRPGSTLERLWDTQFLLEQDTENARKVRDSGSVSVFWVSGVIDEDGQPTG